MTTLKKYVESNQIQWKRVDRDLSEILATYGEPPVYTNKLNRLRKGYRPDSGQRRALIEYTGGEVDDFRDDPETPFKLRRYSSE